MAILSSLSLRPGSSMLRQYGSKCCTHAFELQLELVEQTQSTRELPGRADLLKLCAEGRHPRSAHVAAASFEGVGDALYGLGVFSLVQNQQLVRWRLFQQAPWFLNSGEN